MGSLEYERAVTIRVSGRVQGVGFRFFTHQQAKKLNLTGYVKNLDNGDVQIVACGTNSAIENLINWLADGGPASARITNCDMTEINSPEQYVSFSIRY